MDLISPGTLRERDLILYDQRGSGLSTPNLNCPEVEHALLDALSTAGGWAHEFAVTTKGATVCRQRLEGHGVDLDDYNTPASVRDLETIRSALEVQTWNLAGGSYGTRLGLAYARAHPGRVRSLMLDSVYPPEVSGSARNRALPDAAIARLTEACDAQPSCVKTHGHLDQQLAKAMAALDAHPEVVSIPVDDQGREFTVTGADLKAMIFSAMQSTTWLPSLPGIVSQLAAGDRSQIAVFLIFGVPELLSPSEGDFFSVECADAQEAFDPIAPGAVPPEPGSDATLALAAAEPFCPTWDVADVAPDFAQPVTVDTPTLVFAGTLDPITPYAESKAQAEHMPDARLVTAPGGGHGGRDFNDCTRAAAEVFWHDPAAVLPECVHHLTMAPFEA